MYELYGMDADIAKMLSVLMFLHRLLRLRHCPPSANDCHASKKFPNKRDGMKLK